ncbi:MAG TPA: sortase [Mycobacteriales bacterium]|nr:sortase [Mycobacteriales bacterium]
MSPSFVTPPVQGAGRPVGALLGDALRRPGGRRAVSVLSVVLFLAGAVMFAYPVATDLYSRFNQDRLQEDFRDPSYADAYRERRVAVGEGLTRMRIPKLGVDVLVVEGTTPSALRAGAGHYVETPLPGEPGNVGIAGHRTTYGRPLNRMDELGPGDVVELETPFEVFTYRALPAFDGHGNPWVVAPTQYDVVGQDVQGSFLTLTTCHPKGSARQRLIMRFELVGSRPVERTGTA